MQITLDKVGFSHHGRSVLHDLTGSFQTGQMVSILGTNGAGKTTLLRLILGLARPETGQVNLNGEMLHRIRRARLARLMSYVPQSRDQYSPYTVLQVIRLGRLPHTGLMHRLSIQDDQSVDRAISCLGLQGLQHRPCTRLSGGEYQRVLLARALAQDTAILVLDEPLAGLDYGQQLRFMALLSSLAQQGHLVIMTAHQPDLVYRYATHVILLENGKILAEGRPVEVLDASRLSAFYGVSLRHHDHGETRFFMHDETPK